MNTRDSVVESGTNRRNTEVLIVKTEAAFRVHRFPFNAIPTTFKTYQLQRHLEMRRVEHKKPS